MLEIVRTGKVFDVCIIGSGTAGGTYLTEIHTNGEYPYGISVGGEIIHETGTVRMGKDPRTSALNQYSITARRRCG